MCEACRKGQCENCDGCWHEIEHDFTDYYASDDGGQEADRAADRYEAALDNPWGDA